MALIKCTECGKEISKTAKTCPNCGAKNKKRSNAGALLVLFLIIILAIFFLPNKNNTTTADKIELNNSNIPNENKSIKTKKGEFNVPGYGYIDGRDPNADPPLTLMEPNIWDSFARNKPICTISHGTKVKLIKAKYKQSEKRFYFYVSNKNCEGWLTENFLNSNYKKPIGDKFYK